MGALTVRTYRLPGADPIRIEHLVLDLNGTLSAHGTLIDGVVPRLVALAGDLELHIVTADTLGTAGRLAAALPTTVDTVGRGEDKVVLVRRLGSARTAAIGNGRNDEAMLREAVLGIAVIGPEGAATPTVMAADVVCHSILNALDLLFDEQTLASTLRA